MSYEIKIEGSVEAVLRLLQQLELRGNASLEMAEGDLKISAVGSADFITKILKVLDGKKKVKVVVEEDVEK